MGTAKAPEKSSSWLKQKYFEQQGGNNWTFFGESCDDEGKPYKVRLLLASNTPIQRHVKVQGEANPYDPVYTTYFEKREGDHMAETFGGTRTLRFLWKFQRGFCPVCNTTITRITGWSLHHRVPRALGGSTSAENRVLLQSATTGFIASIFPSRNRVSPKEAFEGPEPYDGKLSRPVLRGLTPSNGGRLLGDGDLTPTTHGVYNPNRSYFFSKRIDSGKLTFCGGSCATLMPQWRPRIPATRAIDFPRESLLPPIWYI